MALETSEILVLSALFQLAQEDRAATLIRLSAQTDLSRDALLPCLDRLHAAGWVDHERLRLTLPGLAVAVAFAPRARRLARSGALAA
jgi:DNA-binding IclR family transcriptional regulator